MNGLSHKANNFFPSCFKVPVSDIFLFPRCDILTWADEKKKCNLEKGTHFCKCSDLKRAGNKPLKPLKNSSAQVLNSEKTDYFSVSGFDFLRQCHLLFPSQASSILKVARSLFMFSHTNSEAFHKRNRKVFC